jgi:thiamine-monophosphate kinase
MLNSEETMIRSMLEVFGRSRSQVNGPFESDAEVVRFGDQYLLITTDEFCEEDHFKEQDPYLLGWNCAAGAVTDILATGGKPLFYLHSLVAKDTWEPPFVRELARGCAELLAHYGIAFLGGDFGRSPTWRCTATVIGQTQRPLLRSGARPGDSLYVSGPVGGGNFEALLKLYSQNEVLDRLTRPLALKISPRPGVAEVIARHASACIDTSDGLFLSLNTLCEQSRVGYCVRDIPYEHKGLLAARAKKLPKELLMLCEAGEYELLAAVPPQAEEAFIEDISRIGETMHRIGEVCGIGLRRLRSRGRILDLGAAPVRARDFADKKRYVEDVKAWLERAKN